MNGSCKQKIIAGLLGVLVVLGGCASAAQQSGQPVEISVWHYYNGTQKAAFDEMAKTFNETEGKTAGIVVTGYNYGDVNQLEESVTAAVNHEVGSREMPDVFATYADTAYTFEQLGLLADLGQYFTPAEQALYVDSYIEEGRIGAGGELKIFPIAKSTEVTLLNKTDWDQFSAATGAQLDELVTLEGVVRVAQAYYEWSDALTPDIPDDGRAFYGRDALANLFIIGTRQMGQELFEVADGKMQMHLEKAMMRRIWDVYYRPHINGYFLEKARFRSDDAKVGDIIALTGSSSAVAYFPTEITRGGETYAIDTVALPTPIFANAEPWAVQQGAGMVVSKTSRAKELAAVTFLKWFTEEERNLRFSGSSGYLPVKKAATDFELFTQVIGESGETLPPAVNDALRVAFQTAKDVPLYTSKAFHNASNVRQVLNFHLSDQLHADLEQIDAKISQGMSRREAIAAFDNDENFERWFASFEQALLQSAE